MQGFDEKQCFSYDFSHGVGQSAVGLARCDAEQGSAAAHSGGHEDANGSDMGAKWEPNAVKMLINIVAKFAIDLGGHCVRFAQTAAACKAILRIRGEIK